MGRATAAQAYERASRPKPAKLATNVALRSKVCREGSGKKYSPARHVRSYAQLADRGHRGRHPTSCTIKTDRETDHCGRSGAVGSFNDVRDGHPAAAGRTAACTSRAGCASRS